MLFILLLKFIDHFFCGKQVLKIEDSIFDALVLFDDFLMMGVTLGSRSCTYGLAHYPINLNYPPLSCCHLKHSSMVYEKLYIFLIFLLWPEIWILFQGFLSIIILISILFFRYWIFLLYQWIRTTLITVG